MTNETKETPELKKPEKKVSLWTTEEAGNIKSVYGCEMLVENGSLQDVSVVDVPTDAFIVTYVLDDQVKYDLTRGTKTHIFDMYYDKFKMGIKIIDYGKGTIKPALWGYQSATAPKKKKKKGQNQN